MTNIVQLRQDRPCNDVAATLRRIADEVEAGEHGDWPVTTCVVLLGHTDSEIPAGDGSYAQEMWWHTYGAGPRCDTFTVRGLIATALNRWDHDHAT
jgi:hypothetical protein